MVDVVHALSVDERTCSVSGNSTEVLHYCMNIYQHVEQGYGTARKPKVLNFLVVPIKRLVSNNNIPVY